MSTTTPQKKYFLNPQFHKFQKFILDNTNQTQPKKFNNSAFFVQENSYLGSFEQIIEATKEMEGMTVCHLDFRLPENKQHGKNPLYLKGQINFSYRNSLRESTKKIVPVEGVKYNEKSKKGLEKAFFTFLGLYTSSSTKNRVVLVLSNICDYAYREDLLEKIKYLDFKNIVVVFHEDLKKVGEEPLIPEMTEENSIILNFDNNQVFFKGFIDVVLIEAGFFSSEERTKLIQEFLTLHEIHYKPFSYLKKSLTIFLNALSRKIIEEDVDTLIEKGYFKNLYSRDLFFFIQKNYDLDEKVILFLLKNLEYMALKRGMKDIWADFTTPKKASTKKPSGFSAFISKRRVNGVKSEALILHHKKYFADKYNQEKMMNVHTLYEILKKLRKRDLVEIVYKKQTADVISVVARSKLEPHQNDFLLEMLNDRELNSLRSIGLLESKDDTI